MFYSREFIDELFLNRDRELYIKIELLTWEELKIKEIQGLVIDGSLNVDGTSIIRRSISLNMVLDPDTYFLPEVANEINISRKIAIYAGLKNNTNAGRFPDMISNEFKYLTQPIVWFNLGIFVPTEVSISHDTENSSISISGQDKMVLLNGDVAGELGYDIDFVNTITDEGIPYQDIIRDSVSVFGGIDTSKILISDVPYYAESLTRVQPNPNRYFEGNLTNSNPDYIGVAGEVWDQIKGKILTGSVIIQIAASWTAANIPAGTTISSIALSGNGAKLYLSQDSIPDYNTDIIFTFGSIDTFYATTTGSYGKRTFNIDDATELTSGTLLSPPINPTDILPLQVVLSPRNKETQIEVASTDKVTTILDQVKSDLLGDYEYFFNKYGDFVFQQKKNLESNFSDITYFQNDNPEKYFANFNNIPYVYNFSDKDIINSFSNSPMWRGIKNDFYVYGANNLLYHLVIDTLPIVPSQFYSQDSNGIWTSTLVSYNQPWQQYIIDLTEYNAQTNPDEEENKYYAELKKYFKYNSEENTGIYKKLSATTGVWRCGNTGQESTDFDFTNKPNGDPFTWNYYFDIISDSDSKVGKFSVNAIGRRIKSIKDDNITIIYPRTLEPTYLDSSNRSVKVILYEDLQTEPVTISYFQVPQKSYKVLNFDGSGDYASANTTVTTLEPMSLEAWVYLNTTSGTQSIIFTSRSGLTRSYAGIILTNAGKFALNYNNETVTNGTGYVNEETIVRTASTWYHVAAVFSSSTSRTLFVNGSAVLTNSTSVSLSTNMNRFLFGVRDNSAFNFYLNGRLSDVRAWNTRRSGSVIVANYTNRLVGNETGLVNYWKVDEESGTSLFDLTTNNRTASITDASWTTSNPPAAFSIGTSTTISATTFDPITFSVGDKINVSNIPSSFTSYFNGNWTVNTVSTDLKTFGFTVSNAITASTYHLNFSRPQYLTAQSGATKLFLNTGSEIIRTGMRVSGLALQADTTVTAVQTSSISASITISKALTTRSLVNNTINFSAGTVSVAKYAEYRTNNTDALRIEAELEASAIPYVSMLKSQIEPFLDNTEFQYKSDAFSTMKNLIYTHTNFNESVSVSAVPLYHLEPNNRIGLSDENTGIIGDHYLQSFSIPLTPDGLMSINAIKIQK